MKPRLTYANVMSTIAAFLALTTSGAYAKATFIDGRNIKANSIRGNSIRNGDVTSLDLKNGSVTTADLSRQTVQALADIPPSIPDGFAYGTDNPRVENGAFVSSVVPTGAGKPCVVIAGANVTHGLWEQTSGGLFTCNNGDGFDHGPVIKGNTNGGANGY